MRIRTVWAAITAGEGLYGLITSDFVRIWLWPAAGWGLTVTLNVLTPVPLPYLFAAATVVAAAIATLIVRIGERRDRITPEGKLIFDGISLLHDVNRYAIQHTLRSVQAVVALRNVAPFPIFYRVDNFELRFMGRTAMAKNKDDKCHEISSLSSKWYYDHTLTINESIDGQLVGEADVSIVYWRKSGVEFAINRKVAVYLVKDGQGQLWSNWRQRP